MRGGTKGFPNHVRVTQQYHRLVLFLEVDCKISLISQQEILRRVFPLLQLHQINVFNLPSDARMKMNCFLRIRNSPLCRALSVAFGNKKLFGARVTIEAPGVDGWMVTLVHGFPLSRTNYLG